MKKKCICFGWLIAVILAGCRTTGPGWLIEVPNEQAPWAVQGLIVSKDGIQRGWIVFHRGIIVATETDERRIPRTARKVRYDGYIFPGLIDTHNHAPWNVIPEWRAGHTFNNRYEWSEHDPAYLREVNAVFTNFISHRAGPDLTECVALKYAEIRALIGGTTLLQSSYREPQLPYLVRPLGSSYLAESRTPDIERITPKDLNRLTNGLSSGIFHRLFLHVAEGKVADPKTASEFPFLESHGLVRNGVVLIHGIALSRAEFRKMAKAGMFLVWSPKSNLVLYGETARVVDALEEGVIVSLAPDWSITGSNNALDEMKVAWDYSRTNLAGRVTAQQLFRMVTVDAAKVAGVDKFLGEIKPRYAADFFLAPVLDPNPYVSLLRTRPRDIQLVVIDGRLTYGEADQMDRWFGANVLDTIEVEGNQKRLIALGDPTSMPYYDQRFSNIVQTLETKLPKLAPLLEK